jgi:GNAT superfamily N-acetyltransferase
MEIKTYTNKELKGFIASSEFQTLGVLPVSSIRAISYHHNPRADREDVVLYLAYHQKQLIAYRLILPDTLHTKGEVLKIGWFSCLYVVPEQRGSGIGRQLTQRAVDDWGGLNAVYDPAVNPTHLYHTVGNLERYPGPIGLKAYLGFNFQQLWKARRRRIPLVNLLLKCADCVLNALNEVRLSTWKRKMNQQEGEAYVYINEIDDETALFIKQHQANELSKRGQQELNWIIKHPWIVTSTSYRDEAIRYHFSLQENEFNYLIIKVLNNTEVVGVLMLQFRNRQLKIPYCYLMNGHESQAVDIIYLHMLKSNASTLTVFNAQLVAAIKAKKHPFWLLRNKFKPLYLSKKLVEKIDSKTGRFQDGDGDNVFT